MDALTAIGLASNVLSFVQFAWQLIQASAEISTSPSGCTADVVSLDTVYTRLRSLSSGLNSCQLYTSDNIEDYVSTDYQEQQAQRQAATAATGLSHLAKQCESDCNELLGLTAKLKVGSPGKWRSFQAALRKVWEKDKIAALETRLQRAQGTMNLHFCMVTR